MKKLVFVGFALALVSAVCVAQDAATPDNARATPLGKPEQEPGNQLKTLTGCLQKGAEPGEVTFTSADGNSWDLRSDRREA